MVYGKSEYRQYEVDFIATDGNEKYYIQSAYEIETEEKREQELNSFKRIDDSFQKIVIVKDDIMPYRDNNGVLFVGLFEFRSSDKPAEVPSNFIVKAQCFSTAPRSLD